MLIDNLFDALGAFLRPFVNACRTTPCRLFQGNNLDAASYSLKSVHAGGFTSAGAVINHLAGVCNNGPSVIAQLYQLRLRHQRLGKLAGTLLCRKPAGRLSFYFLPLIRERSNNAAHRPGFFVFDGRPETLNLAVAKDGDALNGLRASLEAKPEWEDNLTLWHSFAVVCGA